MNAYSLTFHEYFSYFHANMNESSYYLINIHILHKMYLYVNLFKQRNLR